MFAQNILKRGGATTSARVRWAFLRAVGRAPAAAESAALEGLYARSLNRYKEAPAQARELIATGEARRDASIDPGEVAAMTVVARAILNMHETIARN